LANTNKNSESGFRPGSFADHFLCVECVRVLATLAPLPFGILTGLECPQLLPRLPFLLAMVITSFRVKSDIFRNTHASPPAGQFRYLPAGHQEESVPKFCVTNQGVLRSPLWDFPLANVLTRLS